MRFSLTNAIGEGVARNFVTDVLQRRQVKAEKHTVVLDAGVGWFLAGSETMGLVSSPFPLLLRLMDRAGGCLQTIAQKLKPTTGEYDPTKTMEYVAALGLLLRDAKDVSMWVNFDSNELAMQELLTRENPFYAVWPRGNQAATDFGGRISCGDTQVVVLGQVKMKKDSEKKGNPQGFAEVMKLAWSIGKHVSVGCEVKGKLTKLDGPVKAYFVSSRPAQDNKRMAVLIRAFCVAMAGQVTLQDAETAVSHQTKKAKPKKVKPKKADIWDVVKLLASDKYSLRVT